MSPPPVSATSAAHIVPTRITVKSFVKEMHLEDVRNDASAQRSGSLHPHATGNLMRLELGGSLARARSVLEQAIAPGGNDKLEKAVTWLMAGTEQTPGPEVIKYFTVLGGVLSSLDYQLENNPQDPALLAQREKIEQAVLRLGRVMSECKYPPAGSFDVGDEHATNMLVKEYANCETAVSQCMKELGIPSQIGAFAQAVVAPLMLEAIGLRQPGMLEDAKAGKLGLEQLMNLLDPNRVASTNNKIAKAIAKDNFLSYWEAVKSLMKLPEYVVTPGSGKAGPSGNTDKNVDPPIPQNVLNHAREGGAPVLYNSVNVGDTSQQAHGAKGADAQITKDVLTAFADNIMRFLTKGVELGQRSADISKFAEISDQLNYIRNQCEDLQNQNNELKKQKSELQEKNNELMNTNHALWMENGDMTAKNTELSERNVKLTGKNLELTGMVDDLNKVLHSEHLPDHDAVTVKLGNLPSANSGLGSPALVQSTSNQLRTATASDQQSGSDQAAVTNPAIVRGSRVVQPETATSSSSNPLGRVGQPNRFGEPVVQVSSLQQDSNLMPEGMVPERHVKMMSSFFEQRSSAQSSRQAVIGVESRHLGAASNIREGVGEDFEEWPRVARKVVLFEAYNFAPSSGQYGLGGLPFNSVAASARTEPAASSHLASRSVVGSSSPASGFIAQTQSPEPAGDTPLTGSEVITIGRMSRSFESRNFSHSSREAVTGTESRRLGAASNVREGVGEDFEEWPRVTRKVELFEAYNFAPSSGQYGLGGLPFNSVAASARTERAASSQHASRSVVGSSSPVSGFIGRAQSPQLGRGTPLPDADVITIGSKHALDQGKRLNEMRGMINPLEDVFSVKIASESAEPRSLRLDPLLSGDGENENIGERRSNQSMTVFKSAGIGTSHDSGLDARSSDSGSSVEGEDATPDFRKDPSFNQQIINQLNGLNKVDLTARHPSGKGWLGNSIYVS